MNALPTSALPPTNDDREIWDIWLSQFRLPVVNVNAEVGTFRALSDEALTADELAAQLGVDARALAMHLAALCSMGLAEKRLGKWRATHLARIWLHPDGAGFWGHFTRQIDFNETLRARLLESLRTGKRPGESGEDSGDITASGPPSGNAAPCLGKRRRASPISCMPTARRRRSARRHRGFSASSPH